MPPSPRSWQQPGRRWGSSPAAGSGSGKSSSAAWIVEAIEADSGFEFYVPDMRPAVDAKNADVDTFLLQMAAVFKDQLHDE